MSDSSETNKPRSTSEKLRAKQAATQEQKEKLVENMEAYAKSLNAMAMSPNGEIVLKTLIKALEVFTVKSGRDGVALIEVNTKRNFYFEFIRPYLEPSIRQRLEN